MMPEKLLVPFTNKGKQVSLKLSGNETGTEIHNRRNTQGPMGTRFATSANDTTRIASGHQKGSAKNHVTIAQHRKSSAPSLGFGCPSGSTGNRWRREGLGRRVGWKWSQRLSQKGVVPGVGDMKSPPPWWGLGSS